MSTFAYKAIDRGGHAQSGTIMADSHQAAVRELQNKGLLPTQIVEGGSREASRTMAKAAKAAGGPVVRGKVGKKLKLSVLVNFTQQMATLVGAGSQILDSLKLVQSQSVDATLRKSLEDIINDISKGDSLSEAMRKQKRMFPATMVSMIAAGEASGSLEKVLDRYGDYIQRQEEMANRFKTMMVYPAAILAACIGVIVLMLVVVIPKFSEMLNDMGGTKGLPLPTRIVIRTSEIVKSGAGLTILVGSFVGVVTAVILFVKSQAGQVMWDRLRFKIPLLGALAFKLMVARLAVTLSTLVESGVSLIPALLAVRDTLDSHIIRVEIDRIVNAIEHGSALGDAMAEGKMFPALLVQVVKIGEQVGKLGELLMKVGAYFDREARTQSDRVMALIEPVMIMGMGLLVGGMIMTVILPILQQVQNQGMGGG